MSSDIHKTAIIHKNAIIDDSAQIGPYCVIGAGVVIKENVKLKSHVCIEGKTTIDSGTIIYPFASIGQDPQDLKYDEEESQTYIGKNCKIREYVTIQRGTRDDKMLTHVGDNCLLMVGCHVAHDCVVENNVIMANYVSLAGHVIVGESAVIGGHSAIHQFCRIGKNAMVGGMSGVDKDVIPYGLVRGERASLVGLNLIGLRRFGFKNSDIMSLQKTYKNFFENNKEEFSSSLDNAIEKNELVESFKQFVMLKSNRPICTPK